MMEMNQMTSNARKDSYSEGIACQLQYRDIESICRNHDLLSILAIRESLSNRNDA